MSPEAQLRDRLRAVADDGAWYGGMGDDAAVDDVLDRRRTQRRQRVLVGAAAACVATVVAVVPVLTDRDRAPVTGATAADVAMDQLPTRGSLAGDTAYVEVVRDANWIDLSGGFPQPGSRHVAFVGDLDGRRYALVVGRAGDRLLGQWSTGPVGAPADQLVPDVLAADQEDDTQPFVRWSGTPGEPAVVVAAPDETVQVSPRVEVAADGTASREYRDVATEDGVAVVQLGGVPQFSAPGAARYRLVRDGVPAASRALYPLAQPARPLYADGELIGGTYSYDTGPTFPPQLEPRRPGSTPVDATVVGMAGDAVAGPTGHELADVSPQLLWSGQVPLAPGGTSGIAVVAVTLPSGAVAVGVATGSFTADGAGTAAVCGVATFPAGTDLDELTVAARCPLLSVDMGAVGDDGQVYVVTAPPGITRAELIGTAPDGTAVTQLPLPAAGAVVLPSVDDLTRVSVSGPGYIRQRLAVLDNGDRVFAGLGE